VIKIETLKKGDVVYFTKAKLDEAKRVAWYVDVQCDGNKIVLKSRVFGKGWSYFSVTAEDAKKFGMTDKSPFIR
jgi:hypothetical protein